MDELIIIMVCLAVNGFFSCFEMAFVSIPKPQLRQLAKDGSSSAKKLLELRANPERTLSVLQVGITLVGMISAAVGGAGAEESFAPILEAKFGISERTSEAIAIVSIVIPLTFLSVVLGELVPKTIALRDPYKVASIGVRWVVLFGKIFSPVVSIFERSTNLVLMLLPAKKKSPSEPEPTTANIENLSHQTRQYVLNLVNVEARKVKDVLLPWKQVNFVQDSFETGEIAREVISSGHTRLPVMKDSKVIGLLHTKEFIAMLASPSQDWHTIIRPILQVKESETALRILRIMQERRTHFAVVTDLHELPIGIVTMEDIIEEIVGDIYDEDDDGKIKKLLVHRF